MSDISNAPIRRDDPGLPFLLLERASQFAGLLSNASEGIT